MTRPVGRCLGCWHDWRTGPCGGCGAVPAPDEQYALPDGTLMPKLPDPPFSAAEWRALALIRRLGWVPLSQRCTVQFADADMSTIQTCGLPATHAIHTTGIDIPVENHTLRIWHRFIPPFDRLAGYPSTTLTERF